VVLSLPTNPSYARCTASSEISSDYSCDKGLVGTMANTP
jgi:hypothetical protein